MLDLRRLRLLRELARRGTIAAVAQALSYSPSAVSQQLAALEKEAGVRLLEPIGRQRAIPTSKRSRPPSRPTGPSQTQSGSEQAPRLQGRARQQRLTCRDELRHAWNRSRPANPAETFTSARGSWHLAHMLE